MIIRRAVIRQGEKDHSWSSGVFAYETIGRRIAIPFSRSWTRPLATEVDIASIESIESSLDNSLRETKSIEQEIEYKTGESVPQIDSSTHSTHQLAQYGSPQEYNKHRKQRRSTIRNE